MTALRLFRRSRPSQPRQVVLYSRPGCHLCDDARRLLDRIAPKYRLEIREFDITSDPDLVRRYDIRIPVIVIDGRRELDAPIEERALRRALERG